MYSLNIKIKGRDNKHTKIPLNTKHHRLKSRQLSDYRATRFYTFSDFRESLDEFQFFQGLESSVVNEGDK